MSFSIVHRTTSVTGSFLGPSPKSIYGEMRRSRNGSRVPPAQLVCRDGWNVPDGKIAGEHMLFCDPGESLTGSAREQRFEAALRARRAAGAGPIAGHARARHRSTHRSRCAGALPGSAQRFTPGGPAHPSRSARHYPLPRSRGAAIARYQSPDAWSLPSLFR